MEYRHIHVVPAFPVPADLTVITVITVITIITARVSSSQSADW